MSITSDQVNLLIYRYLLESGFNHSAYTFSNESLIQKSEMKNVKVDTGALLLLLQKGLLFSEAEAHLNEDGSERQCDRPFTLLQAHECERRNSGNYNKRRDRERSIQNISTYISGPGTYGDQSSYGIGQQQQAAEDWSSQQQQQHEQQSIVDGQQQEYNGYHGGSASNTGDNNNKLRKRDNDDMEVEDSTPGVSTADIPTASSTPVLNKKFTAAVPQSEVLLLEGHQSEVFKCQWNPHKPILATASADASTRLWTVPVGSSIRDSSSFQSECTVLDHLEDGGSSNVQKDVTSLNWNPSGDTLATGNYNGTVRFWSVDGQLQKKLPLVHNGPIFSVKWSLDGQTLLTGGFDSVVCAWNSSSGKLLKKFDGHSAPVLEIDWRDSDMFASCSTDKTIRIESLSSGDVQVLKSHQKEINEIQWNNQKDLLASCSDDATAKIWSLSQNTPIQSLNGHEKEIYSIEWSPTANDQLATASFDHTVKIWSAETGQCIHNLAKHKQSVYTLSYSPDGRLIASGGYDGRVIVWSARDGTVVRHYKGQSGIFDCNFSPDGNFVAATFAGNTACIFDIRMLSSIPLSYQYEISDRILENVGTSLAENQIFDRRLRYRIVDSSHLPLLRCIVSSGIQILDLAVIVVSEQLELLQLIARLQPVSLHLELRKNADKLAKKKDLLGLLSQSLKVFNLESSHWKNYGVHIPKLLSAMNLNQLTHFECDDSQVFEDPHPLLQAEKLQYVNLQFATSSGSKTARHFLNAFQVAVQSKHLNYLCLKNVFKIRDLTPGDDQLIQQGFDLLKHIIHSKRGLQLIVNDYRCNLKRSISSLFDPSLPVALSKLQLSQDLKHEAKLIQERVSPQSVKLQMLLLQCCILVFSTEAKVD
ncbi:hypothetical protein MP228_007405 [Amoeboaphelidium protococcarum]|nr:hypothetical protein MP228_007405 [Amoeboaphelidium protococcarum]